MATPCELATNGVAPHRMLGHTKVWREKSRGNALALRWERVASVEALPPEDTYDLEIDHVSHNYVADGVVVHNSQRYSPVHGALFETPEIRLKNPAGNRQSSVEVEAEEARSTFELEVKAALASCQLAYENILNAGGAPECARMVLPLCTKTRMYMKGSIRSWIHYFEVRCTEHAQKEHRQIAEAAKDIFCDQFPATASALGWVARPCGTCSGQQVVDSGGVNPDQTAIMVPCPACCAVSGK